MRNRKIKKLEPQKDLLELKRMLKLSSKLKENKLFMIQKLKPNSKQELVLQRRNLNKPRMCHRAHKLPQVQQVLVIEQEKLDTSIVTGVLMKEKGKKN